MGEWWLMLPARTKSSFTISYRIRRCVAVGLTVGVSGRLAVKLERTYSTRSCAREESVEAGNRWAERPSLWGTNPHEKADVIRE